MRYRCPSRLRRVAKWVGLGACVFLFWVWIVTCRCVIGYQATTLSIQLSDGCFIVSGYSKAVFGGVWHAAWVPANFFWQPVLACGSSLGAQFSSFVVPLWLPLIAIGVPTGILWYRDRKPIPPGHCLRCGYNLTGNESGVCPECATPVPKLETTA